jgi:hypothetical protein
MVRESFAAQAGHILILHPASLVQGFLEKLCVRISQLPEVQWVDIWEKPDLKIISDLQNFNFKKVRGLACCLGIQVISL